MAVTVPYVTHAQVLSKHPRFLWDAAVDVSGTARDLAGSRFGIGHVFSAVDEIGTPAEFDVLVLATPPDSRLPILGHFPNLKAVVVEKPLGASLQESGAFVDECRRRGLVTQVNLTRRADTVMRRLAGGELASRIGRLQCGAGVYGNGIVNYATHTIDLVRMLAGEVRAVQALNRARKFQEGPLAGDQNLSFTLFLEGGAPVTLHPVSFARYREGSLDLWGEEGRLEILQEGLVLRSAARRECRSLVGAHEVSSDSTLVEPTGYGHALYDLYDDLALALDGAHPVTCSPCESALATEKVVHAVLASRDTGGTIVELC